MTIYEQNGYTSRSHYLTSLALNTGTDIEMINYLAELLGENEDFDGLVSAVNDLEDELWSML